MTNREPIIHIEPAAGGVKLFVPLDPVNFDRPNYQRELIIRAQQVLLSCLVSLSTEQLPVIA